MRRSLAKWMVGLACSISLAPGCGTDPGAQPPPIAVPESARTIFMVTPGPPESDLEGWVTLAQLEANRERVIFRSLGPATNQSPAAQPEMVRKAIGDGASALIVVASDAPGLPEALAEAESKQVPVVVIGRPIPSPAGSPPFTYVAPTSFDTSADQLVQTALADAKKAGLPAAGSALILVDRVGGAFSADRTTALEGAATRAGLKVRLVEFEPPADSPSANEAIKTVGGTVDLALLLAMDESAMQLATQARRVLSPGRKFFVAGYSSHLNASMPGVYGSESAYVDYRGELMGRLAVQAALERLRGEQAGRKVALELRFQRGLASDSGGSGATRPIEKESVPAKAPDEPKKSSQ